MEIRWKHLGYMLTFLVLMFAAIVVFAERPPKRMLEYVTSHKLAHDGKCDIKSQKGVECLIYYDEANDIIWLILFDNPPTRITAIIGVKDGKETVLWSDAIWQQRHTGTKKRRNSKN